MGSLHFGRQGSQILVKPRGMASFDWPPWALSICLCRILVPISYTGLPSGICSFDKFKVDSSRCVLLVVLFYVGIPCSWKGNPDRFPTIDIVGRTKPFSRNTQFALLACFYLWFAGFISSFFWENWASFQVGFVSHLSGLMLIHIKNTAFLDSTIPTSLKRLGGSRDLHIRIHADSRKMGIFPSDDYLNSLCVGISWMLGSIILAFDQGRNYQNWIDILWCRVSWRKVLRNQVHN